MEDDKDNVAEEKSKWRVVLLERKEIVGKRGDSAAWEDKVTKAADEAIASQLLQKFRNRTCSELQLKEDHLSESDSGDYSIIEVKNISIKPK